MYKRQVMLFAALATITYAQTDDKGYQEGAWVLKGVTGLNMSQTAMANWSAGGENSIAGNAYLNASLTHKKGNWLWVTNMVLDYGLSKTKSQGTVSYTHLLMGGKYVLPDAKVTILAIN